MTPDNWAEIRELADRHCTGLLTTADAERLNGLLCDNADAQRAFLEVTSVYARLQWEFGGVPVAPAGLTPPVVPTAAEAAARLVSPPVVAPPISVAWPTPLTITIVALLLMGGVVALVSRRAAVPAADEPAAQAVAAVATLKNVVDAKWALGCEPAGAALLPGRLRLEQGLAEIEFACGAAAVLRGPAEIELVEADKAFLHAGQVLVRVPHEGNAAGFRVETPTSQLLDLGTEFGVEVDAGGSSLLQVYEGEVLASAKAEATTRSPQRVVEGQAVRLDGSLHETAFWPERFVRLLPGPTDPLGRGFQPYNHSVRDSVNVLPTSGQLTIDGDLSDWNLAGQFRAVCEPPYAENYYLEAAMMYDAECLYLAAHVGDPHPMRSQILPSESIDRHGMGGAVALRISTDRKASWPLQAEGTGALRGRPATAADLNDKLSFVLLWYCQAERRACLDVRHGMDMHGAQTNPPDYRGVFRQAADGRGYTLEYAIPWSLLSAADDPPQAGDELATMWLAHWSDTEGRRWQGQLIEVMRPNEPGWNFERAATWGKAIYLRPKP